MNEQPWWRNAVIYQIYPRSFQDSNADGIGDLSGILDRADYLQWLGIDAVWISPIYPSPMADFGYDVADYCNIDPMFGTLADFDRLVEALHARGLRIILEELMLELMYHLPQQREPKELTITREMVTSKEAHLPFEKAG